MNTPVIGLIGLGRMGAAMAARMNELGIEVIGHDADPAALARRDGWRVASSPAEVAARARAVILSLPTPDAVESVLFGEQGVCRGFVDGGLVIDTSTSDPRRTVDFAARLADRGIALVDAPVSGGPAGARAGTLTIALGGRPADRMAARRVLERLAADIFDVGDIGSGHMAKLVNNFSCAANLLIAGELARMAAAEGFDADAVMKVVAKSSGRSGVIETNYPKWISGGNFDSGFTVGLMTKDIRMAVDVAAAGASVSELMSAVLRRWEDAVDRLGAQADFNRAAVLPPKEGL